MNKPIPILLATLSLLAASVASADDPMPKSRAEALTMEAEDALPLTGFYDPPPLDDRVPMLSPPMLARYRDMTTKGCWYYDYAAAAEIGHQAAVRPGWNEAPELVRYNRDSRSTDEPIRGPLMVLAGDDDASVNFANIKAGVAQACRHHLPIEFVHRPGLDHDPLMDKTIGLQLDWARARLEGRPWRGTCVPGKS